MIPYLCSSFVVIVVALWLSTRRLPRSPLPATLLFICLVLGQISIIILSLGLFNQLHPLMIVITSIGLGLVLTVGNQFIKVQMTVSDLNVATEKSANQELNQSGIVASLILGFILAVPFMPMLSDLVIQVLNVHPLSWDVVSYHLPNAVDYLQTSSLWTMQGDFSQYPGGNELLLIWSFLPLGLDTMLGLTTLTLGLGLMLAATLLLRDVITVRNAFAQSLQILALWLLCFSVPDFQTIWFDLGRNDLTVGFWLLVATWTFTRFSFTQENRHSWLLWTGISLGFAVGTKPNALYYWLGFFILSLCPICSQEVKSAESAFQRSKWWQQLVHRFAELGIPVLLIAGFWYARNIIVQGTIFQDQILYPGRELTIIRHLFNPNLYQLQFPILFLFGASLITIITISLKTLFLPLNSKPLQLLAWINGVGIGAWILTPHGAGYWVGTKMILSVQLRYGIVLIPLTVILLINLIALLFYAIPQKNLRLTSLYRQITTRFYQTSSLHKTWKYLGCSVSVGIVLGLGQLATYQPPLGLPGYGSILFTGINQNSPKSQSQIYAWIQKNIHNKIIYAVGLRPYGLYGFPFTNRVISGGSPESWQYQSFQQTQQTWHPEYIVFSVDPFTGKVSPDIKYLLRDIQTYKPVFRDSYGIVFKVVNP
ncbi:hypothetical protein [Synechococcus sp. PCC 6312]|uniref:hypothetical protein n=1 Tax=Synechococcus sp. (strain ATCC 27167 / PCC 6312) TaxID=195253 RepID=UPI00029ED657|nr:hypothetical protein [Synechococcus sp. PCC 6312]AFY61768.1 hypothetical protein Syn6312_2680 [Synechococcus sp. PCC 6312]